MIGGGGSGKIENEFTGFMQKHVGLSVCLSGFTQATLCTTTMVYGVLVHQEGAICTTKAQYAP